MNNFLIKSADISAINSFIEHLTNRDSKKNVKLILVDNTYVAFNRFQDDEHLLIPILNDVEKIHGLFTWLMNTIKERRFLLSKNKCSDTESFNLLTKTVNHDVLPDIYLIVNEAYYIQSEICNKEYISLFLDSTSVGIHIVLFTKFTPSKLRLGLAGDLFEICSIQQLNDYFFEN